MMGRFEAFSLEKLVLPPSFPVSFLLTHLFRHFALLFKTKADEVSGI